MAKKKLVQLVNCKRGGGRFFLILIDDEENRRFPKKKNLEKPPRLDFENVDFQAKINEEYQQQKTLEKPEVKDDSRVRASSSSSLVLYRKDDVLETVPPAPANKLPLTVGGEDKDPVARERRDKVKEVSTALSFTTRQ